MSKNPKLKQIFIPGWLELFVYFCVALLINVLSFRQYFLNLTGLSTEFETRQQSLRGSRSFWEAQVIERLGFALLWVVLGLFIVYVLWLGLNISNEVRNARRILTNYANINTDQDNVTKDVFARCLWAVSPWLFILVGGRIVVPIWYTLSESAYQNGFVIWGALALLIATLLMSMFLRTLVVLAQTARSSFR